MKQFNEQYIYDIFARNARYELGQGELDQLLRCLEDSPQEFSKIQDYSAIVLLNVIDTKLMALFVEKFFCAVTDAGQQFDYLKAHCEHASFTQMHLQKFIDYLYADDDAFANFLERARQFPFSSMTALALSKLYRVNNSELRLVICANVHPFQMFNMPQLSEDVKVAFVDKLVLALSDEDSVALFDKASNANLIRHILSLPELKQPFQLYCSTHRAVCKRVLVYYEETKDDAAKELLQTMHPYHVLNVVAIRNGFMANFEEQLQDAFSEDRSGKLFLRETRKILIHNILSSEMPMIRASFAQFCGSNEAVFEMVLEMFMTLVQEQDKNNFLQLFVSLFGVVSFEKVCGLEHIVKMLNSGDAEFRMLLLKEYAVFDKLASAHYEFIPDDQDLLLQLIADSHLQFLFDDKTRYENILTRLRTRIKVLLDSNVALVQSVYRRVTDRHVFFGEFSDANYSTLLCSADANLIEKFFNNASSQSFDLAPILQTAVMKIANPEFYQVLLSERYKQCIGPVFEKALPQTFCALFRKPAFRNVDLCEALVEFDYYVGLEQLMPNEQQCTLVLLQENSVLRELIFKQDKYAKLRAWYQHQTGDSEEEVLELRAMSAPAKGRSSRRQFVYVGDLKQPKLDVPAPAPTSLLPPPPPPPANAPSMEEFFKSKRYNSTAPKTKPKYKNPVKPEGPQMNMEEVLAAAKARRKAYAAKLNSEDGKTGLTPPKKKPSSNQQFAMFGNLKSVPKPDDSDHDDDDKHDFSV